MATTLIARQHAVDGHPERSEGSDSPGTEILRCAQDDMRGWEGRPLRSPSNSQLTLTVTSSTYMYV